MIPRPPIPPAHHHRLASYLLGLSAFGLGVLSAQDRAERFVPSADRAPVSRPAPQTPAPPVPMPQIPRARDSQQRSDPSPRPSRTQGDPASKTGLQPPRGVVPPRPDPVRYHPGTRIIIPPPWERCSALPNSAYWRERDLMAEIQGLSRSGLIPVIPIGEEVEVLSDYAQSPAGWRAYGIAVPAGGIVMMEVQHPKSAWFRLMIMDQWGQYQPGMRAEAFTPNPLKVGYQNQSKEAKAVYIIVDDPGWWSGTKDPYTLLIQRDWHPAKADLKQVKTAVGLLDDNPIVTIEARYMSPHGAFFK